MEKKKERAYLIYFCVGGVFAVLAYLFPYTGDDWMWGTTSGVKLLQAGFEGYNGRYAGNLLVLLLTRYKTLRVLAVSGSLFLIAYWIKQIVNRERPLLFLVSAVFLLFLPKEVMRETLVWTSGYSNYVTSAVLLLAFFYAVRRMQDQTIVVSPKYAAAAMILGVINALFVEHVTLANIFLGMVWLIYTGITNRKVIKIPILFLIGAILGAAVMFQNTAYHNVASETDPLYRSIYLTYLPTLINRIKENLFETILPYGVEANLAFHGLGAVLVLWIGRNAVKRKRGWKKVLLTMIRYIPAMYAAFLTAKRLVPGWNPPSYLAQKMEILFVAMDFLAWIGFYGIVLEKNVRDRMILYLVGAAAMAAPLFVVTPIGPRCFYGIYVLLTLSLVELFQVAFPTADRDGRFLCGTTAAGLAVFMFWGNIYGHIYVKENERIQNIKEQIAEADGREIVVKWEQLPFQEYLWCADISRVGEEEEIRIREFKEFYGIPDTITFDFEKGCRLQKSGIS